MTDKPNPPTLPLDRDDAPPDLTKTDFFESARPAAEVIRRIQRLAGTVTRNQQPAALADLDVPFRVGACEAGKEG